MTMTVPPKRAAAYTTYISLVSQADPDIFITSATLAAGDVTVSKDGAAFANIATLPVEIGTSGVLNVTLSSTEMTADQVVVRFRDAAGDEWQDALIVIHTANQTLNDMSNKDGSLTFDNTTDSLEGIASVLSDSTVTTVDVVDGDTVSVRRDTRWAFSLTGAGDISGRTALYFTVKSDLENDADSESILQLEETQGLLYVDGAAATAAGNGALTVDDEDAGDFSVAVEVAELTGGTRGEYTWGLKMIDADGPTMMAKGVFRRGYAVARATS